jgi:hypothetical protein
MREVEEERSCSCVIIVSFNNLLHKKESITIKRVVIETTTYEYLEICSFFYFIFG